MNYGGKLHISEPSHYQYRETQGREGTCFSMGTMQLSHSMQNKLVQSSQLILIILTSNQLINPIHSNGRTERRVFTNQPPQ